jgi:hypothetical protein
MLPKIRKCLFIAISKFDVGDTYLPCSKYRVHTVPTIKMNQSCVHLCGRYDRERTTVVFAPESKDRAGYIGFGSPLCEQRPPLRGLPNPLPCEKRSVKSLRIDAMSFSIIIQFPGVFSTVPGRLISLVRLPQRCLVESNELEVINRVNDAAMPRFAEIEPHGKRRLDSRSRESVPGSGFV